MPAGASSAFLLVVSSEASAGLSPGRRLSASGCVALVPGRYLIWKLKSDRNWAQRACLGVQLFCGHEVLEVLVISEDFEGFFGACQFGAPLF